MTVHEACEVLGIRRGASLEDIKAAYRERAKRYHPDLNSEGTDSLEHFRRVQAAYETLTRGNVERGDGTGGRSDGAAGEDILDLMRLVRAFLEQNDIEILFDGSVRKRSAPRMAMTQVDVEACLSSEDIDALWLVDEILLSFHAKKIKLKTSEVERALRRVIREDQRQRRNRIVKPLLAGIDPTERARAEEEWRHLASSVFTTEAALAVGVLKHFIWQVKQKLLKRSVKHHLMPVVYSPEQGSGKTTFVLQFLEPLRELAIGPVLLSDFADKRSGDIYRFPALFIDDMERIDPRLVPVLKSLITSEGIRRRRLGTSLSTTIPQLTTLIGTANLGIDELVADETGHRRFATLTFRNGEVANGGGPQVWEAVDRTDYELLWRSVDAFGPCPIEHCLGDLYRLQAASRKSSHLAAWLMSLDLGSDAVRRITTKEGVKAKALWELFREETGSTMSMTGFGMEMARLAADPEMPFDSKVVTMNGTFYPLRTSGS
jgi:DnaJ domain/Virulence-associated protein E